MNLFSWNKTSLFLTLLTSLNIIKTDSVKNEKLNVLATALFYTDAQGQALLITGPLSKQTEKIIHLQVKGLMQPESLQDIRVVTKLKKLNNTPSNFTYELLNIIKKEHPDISGTVFKLKLNASDSRRILNDMRRNTVARQGADQPEESPKAITPETQKPQENVEKNTGEPKPSVESRGKVPADDDLIPFDTNFVPNDIFFVVEKKCANWKLDCGVKNDFERHGSYLGMYENALPVANWLP